MLRWVSKCFDEDEKQGKRTSKFHMRVAFYLFPVLEKEVALFNLRYVQRPAGDDDLTQHEQHTLEASLIKVFTKAVFDGAVISARFPSDRESAFSQQLGLTGSISAVLERGTATEERGTGQEHSSQEHGRGWSMVGAGRQVLGPSKGGTEPDACGKRPPIFSNPMHAASARKVLL
jgi:hypothetical protein